MRFATIGTSSIVQLFGEAVEKVDGTTWTVAHSRDPQRAREVAQQQVNVIGQIQLRIEVFMH